MIESKHLPREMVLKSASELKINRGAADEAQKRKIQICKRIAARLNGLRQAIEPLNRGIFREKQAIIIIIGRAASEANRAYGLAIARGVSALFPFTRSRTTAKIITQADEIILALNDLMQSGAKLGKGNRILRESKNRVTGHRTTIRVFSKRLERIQRDIKRLSAEQRRFGCPL